MEGLEDEELDFGEEEGGVGEEGGGFVAGVGGVDEDAVGSEVFVEGGGAAEGLRGDGVRGEEGGPVGFDEVLHHVVVTVHLEIDYNIGGGIDIVYYFYLFCHCYFLNIDKRLKLEKMVEKVGERKV